MIEKSTAPQANIPTGRTSSVNFSIRKGAEAAEDGTSH